MFFAVGSKHNQCSAYSSETSKTYSLKNILAAVSFSFVVRGSSRVLIRLYELTSGRYILTSTLRLPTGLLQR